MAAHSELRNALLAKLKVTPQRLHQLAQKRKAQLPMTTVQAYYTIAHDEGIDISRYLSPAETAEVRGLVAQLKAAGPPPAARDGRAARRKPAAAPRGVRVKFGGVDVELPGLKDAHAKEAREMANVYSSLYLLENSLRDVIERVLKAGHGPDWWAKAVPRIVQQTAANRKAAEKKDAWHGKRGARPIDYVDLSQLAHIIKHNWKAFEKIFQSPAWIEVLITDDLNVSRRVVAHMNPLAADDIRNVENAFRKYAKVLKANEAEVP